MIRVAGSAREEEGASEHQRQSTMDDRRTAKAHLSDESDVRQDG